MNFFHIIWNFWINMAFELHYIFLGQLHSSTQDLALSMPIHLNLLQVSNLVFALHFMLSYLKHNLQYLYTIRFSLKSYLVFTNCYQNAVKAFCKQSENIKKEQSTTNSGKSENINHVSKNIYNISKRVANLSVISNLKDRNLSSSFDSRFLFFFVFYFFFKCPRIPRQKC